MAMQRGITCSNERLYTLETCKACQRYNTNADAIIEDVEICDRPLGISLSDVRGEKEHE